MSLKITFLGAFGLLSLMGLSASVSYACQTAPTSYSYSYNDGSETLSGTASAYSVSVPSDPMGYQERYTATSTMSGIYSANSVQTWVYPTDECINTQTGTAVCSDAGGTLVSGYSNPGYSVSYSSATSQSVTAVTQTTLGACSYVGDPYAQYKTHDYIAQGEHSFGFTNTDTGWSEAVS